MMEFTFFPKPQIAKSLQSNFQLRLKQSTLDMLEQLREHSDTIFSNSLIDAFDSMESSGMNGFHSFAYHHSIELAGASRFEEIAWLLGKLSRGYDKLPRFVSTREIDSELLSEIFGDVGTSMIHKSIVFARLDSAREEDAIRAMNEGFSHLKKVYPDLAAEVNILTRNIVFFESCGDTSERALSFTGNMLQSLILVNGSLDPSWVFLLDKLVHESAHAYLFCINLEEELVNNTEGAIYSSPLRRDARDMVAIYHATFVIQRLILAFSRILADGGINIEERQRIASNLKFYHSRLDVGYGILKQYGKLSPLAHRLVDEGQQCAKSLLFM